MQIITEVIKMIQERLRTIQEELCRYEVEAFWSFLSEIMYFLRYVH